MLGQIGQKSDIASLMLYLSVAMWSFTHSEYVFVRNTVMVFEAAHGGILMVSVWGNTL